MANEGTDRIGEFDADINWIMTRAEIIGGEALSFAVQQRIGVAIRRVEMVRAGVLKALADGDIREIRESLEDGDNLLREQALLRVDCRHEDFYAVVAVARIEDAGAFLMEARVCCKQCGIPMRFLGVEAGLSYEEPRVSIDSVTLHAPMEPETEKQLQGVARYDVPDIPTRH